MATIRISTPLRPYTDGKPEVTLHGKTIADVMDDLTSQYPGLRPHLFSSEGDLRSFVHLFVNDEDIENLEGMQTPVKDSDRIMLIPSIAGG